MAQALVVPAGWEGERVFVDGDDWFDGVLAAIASAQHSVWIETYSLDPDPIGELVVAAVTAAAGRGCLVRLLVDGVGSAAWVQAATGGRGQIPAIGGLQVRVWHPLPWAIARRVRWSYRWRWLRRINRRNHRKICVIDGREAWVGSINWVKEHSRRCCGDTVWHDLSARVAGPGVAALESAMATAWRQGWTLAAGRMRRGWRRPPAPPRVTSASVRLNHTMAVRRAAYRDLMARFNTAQRRIWITNAYVVPRGSFLRALEAAARRGVDVRLLGPGVSDHAFMTWIVALFADTLSAAGAHVFAYRSRILHAKSMLIDDVALVGSHNLNSRSFLHDLEAEVVLTDPAAVALLAATYEADLWQADELRPPALARLRWWQRLVARAALLAKRWL